MMHNDNIPTSSDKSNNFSGYLAGHLIAKQKKSRLSVSIKVAKIFPVYLNLQFIHQIVFPQDRISKKILSLQRFEHFVG